MTCTTSSNLNSVQDEKRNQMTFSHKFSGWSVWLEPCGDASTSMKNIMKDLKDKCGGEERGLHEFTPHCTLLYNTHLDINQDPETNNESQILCEREKSIGSMLLKRCIQKYEIETKKLNALNKDKPKPSKFELVPTSLYYFPYPKMADDGRGFGCVIALVILENKEKGNLELLHQIVSSIFPPDERHGDASGTFTPHISLVYAPESEIWLQNEIIKPEYTKLLDPLPAKYLSLWRTQGEISEWYKVAHVQLY